LPAGIADILKIALRASCAVDELDIVVERRTVDGGTPARVPADLATCANFERL
jgi:hypothetical protein